MSNKFKNKKLDRIYSDIMVDTYADILLHPNSFGLFKKIRPLNTAFKNDDTKISDENTMVTKYIRDSKGAKISRVLLLMVFKKMFGYCRVEYKPNRWGYRVRFVEKYELF